MDWSESAAHEMATPQEELHGVEEHPDSLEIVLSAFSGAAPTTPTLIQLPLGITW